MLADPVKPPDARRRARIKLGLLLVWLLTTVGSVYFARHWQATVLGWPLNHWLAAQGALLVFLAVLLVDVWSYRGCDEAFDAPD